MNPSVIVALVAIIGGVIGGTTPPSNPSAAPAEVIEYRVDPNHAHVGFAVRHLGLSKVRGTFTGVQGHLRYDPDDISASSVEVTIDATSLDTDNERRDKDVKENFLEVQDHPEITFRSTAVRRMATGLEITGELTMHGVTREVVFPFELIGPIPGRGAIELIAVEGALTVDRRDYGISLSRVLETGAIVVGNEVEIELAVEFGRRKGDAGSGAGG